jgi:hypothetical protein
VSGVGWGGEERKRTANCHGNTGVAEKRMFPSW